MAEHVILNPLFHKEDLQGSHQQVLEKSKWIQSFIL